MENANFYIFTGGPGSGKSTVLDLLGNMGYRIVREVARDIIRNQVKTRGDALPWDNTVRYARLMLLRSVVDFEEMAHVPTPCFFDRGIIGIIAPFSCSPFGKRFTPEMPRGSRRWKSQEGLLSR